MKRILLCFLIILLISKIVVLSGCANMIPPTGGDRDSLPPLLLKVTPPDSSKGFNTKTITFTFDEFVDQPQDFYKNLIVSPNYSVPPGYDVKLRTLTVKIKDTLEPNTTYYYNFGDAIKDINEGNILHNFSYIFTTGNTLDTLQLSGKVVLAETGGIDSTLIVMLYKSGKDSAVINDNARYIARLDGKGNFRFLYLPQGIYYIYAMDNSKRYSDKSLFAFSDSAIGIRQGASPLTLYAFTETKEQLSSTINFTGGNRPGGKPDERRLKFSSNLSGNMQDLLGDFNLTFERPLRNLDTSKLQLSTDTTFNPASATWKTDSLKKKLTLKINWKENTLYNLILDKDFAEDSSGRKLLKTDTISFTTKKQADYGSLKISFTNIALSRNPVLQFSQNGQVIKTFPLSSTELYQALFNPGDYDLSILYDENKNGHWDPGKFFGERKQPELVKPLNKKITIRPSWDNEFEITL
ncbi:MAG TPA: Ig-like domain-containing protein [Chitinophagaceae bacterium]|nr:Ig-like domain-containing protein [Chitinophagaceae bacterium]